MEQQPGVHQVEPRAVVDALDGAGVSTPHETVEEGVALRALSDADDLRVLPRDADAGVPHDERQEPGLTFSEAVLDDRLNAVGAHRSNSSMTLGVRPPRPPRPPPPLPLMLRLMPLYLEKPERVTLALCAPR